MTTALEMISEKITTAKRFADVFGEIRSDDVAQNLRKLRKQYVYMVKFIHPDHVSKEEKMLANRVFANFVGLYEQAKDALENDSYEIPILPSNAQGMSAAAQDSVIASSSRKYVVKSTAWAEGDFSDIHLGKTEDGIPVFVKIAADPTMNQYLEHEVLMYMSMDTSSKKNVVQYIPKLVDSMFVDLGGNRQICVNVFTYQEDYVSLTKIREIYPNGLDPRDAAWIWRRVLGQTITAKMLGVVHGAMVPDHTLVHPITHDPLYIGWAHTVLSFKDTHAHLTTCIDRWKNWYPKEVFDHKVPTHKTDLYMAGKTMLYLLGGDVVHNHFPKTVPQQMQRIVQRCVEVNSSKRPESGYEVLQQFTDVIYKLWGKTYRPLVMPR